MLEIITGILFVAIVYYVTEKETIQKLLKEKK